MTTISPIRPSPIAGMWYEGNPRALSQVVDRFLDQAEIPALPGEVIAVISPHAGHKYSGPVAGYAFAAVRSQSFDLVAILSPMHQPYYDSLLTTAHEAYSTPLGNVPVDKKLISDLDARLRKVLGDGLVPVAYDQEHSLEIELPFLQRALTGEFMLLPVMVRSQSAGVSQKLGLELAETLRGKNALIVPVRTFLISIPKTKLLCSTQKCCAGWKHFHRRMFSLLKKKRRALLAGWVL